MGVATGCVVAEQVRNLQCRDRAQSCLAVIGGCYTNDDRSGCRWRAAGFQHPPTNSRLHVVGLHHQVDVGFSDNDERPG